MIAYRLKDSNELYEVEGDKLGLTKKFPRYEQIWAKYIVPLTLRPHRIDPKVLPAELEYFVMAHYSTWYHFTLAYHQISILRTENRQLSAIPSVDVGEPVFHLATAADQAKCAITSVLRIRASLRRKQALDRLVTTFRNSGSNNWHDQFMNITDTRTTVVLRDNFLDMVGRVGDYRHVMTHSTVRMIILKEEKLFLPKQDRIKDYWLWSKIKSRDNDDCFEEVSVVYSRLADDLAKATNELWSLLDPALEDIRSDSRYRILFTPVEDNANPHPASLSIPVTPSALDMTANVNSSATTNVITAGLKDKQ